MVNNIIMKIVYHYQNNLQLGRGIWSLYMGLESFDFWLLIFCSLCKSLETLMEFLFWPLCWAVCLRSMRCLLCLLSPLDGSQRRLRQTNCRIIAYSGNLVFLHVCNSLLYCKCCTPTVVEQLLPTPRNCANIDQICFANVWTISQRLLMLVLQTACKQPDLVEWEHNA